MTRAVVFLTLSVFTCDSKTTAAATKKGKVRENLQTKIKNVPRERERDSA